ncbi:hypothetical protein MtrunA17_Chr1g0208611 [Medicago truncatula]|uniref:Uncharacterized protein n=1 Tax=Medicago truncatula TaxID=3880 RepID=A0A396K2C7_MEDTR|nr:hypothetical protein MtrunA17_Chr1g0208611 [Medicago truncatula]
MACCSRSNGVMVPGYCKFNLRHVRKCVMRTSWHCGLPLSFLCVSYQIQPFLVPLEPSCLAPLGCTLPCLV